jgi:cell division protein FtsL
MKGGNLLPMTLIVLVMLSALAVVQIKHRNQALTSQLDRLRHDQQQLEQEWSQLQLEQATLAQHGRVDQLARTQFGMVEPAQSVITGAGGSTTMATTANGFTVPEMRAEMRSPAADRVGPAPAARVNPSAAVKTGAKR